MHKCAHLLSRPEEQHLGYVGGRGITRYIDLNLFPNYGVKFYEQVDNIGSEKIHYVLQRQLIDLVSGCELAVFNDPTVVYDGTDAFNGVTGTMSNILACGHYHLYLHVLKIPGIRVNACFDLCCILERLLTHVDYTPIGEFSMPHLDLLALKEIIANLLKLEIPDGLFSDEWFNRFIEAFNNLHKRLLTKTYYRNNPNLSWLIRNNYDTDFIKIHTKLFELCDLQWFSPGRSLLHDYPQYAYYENMGLKWKIDTGTEEIMSNEATQYFRAIQSLFRSRQNNTYSRLVGNLNPTKQGGKKIRKNITRRKTVTRKKLLSTISR